MIFRRSTKTVKKGAKGMDKLVTGIIVGGAAASIFGIAKTKKGKKMTQKIYDFGKNTLQGGVSTFGKVTVKFLELFQKKEK
ncbi:hypothetical protein N9J72_02615 [Candidatus Gracilibacteria bacterium]|nr:hypothetical protein [Candidatus Gracilibacteria bacterium]